MKVTVNDVCIALEELAPLALQESYDNAGLLVGNRSMELTAVLLCIDITEEVIQEALATNCNMIISHHPLIFKGLKSITGRNMVERCVITAIQKNIAIYACHTNLDSVTGGVSARMAEKIGLINTQVLQPKTDSLLKLITFVPNEYLEELRSALFEAGAGAIGDYDCCSYSSNGEGTFCANSNCNPFVGKIGEVHTEPEARLEIILPSYLKVKITKVLLATHPYEVPAYDFIPLANNWNSAGYGMIGDLEEVVSEEKFLATIKELFKVERVKYTALTHKKIKKVALCGGSGADLLSTAIATGADVYISADFKYHDYFLAEGRLLIVDIGHFESEQFTKEIIFDHLTKKLPKFALRFSDINTNPINYL